VTTLEITVAALRTWLTSPEKAAAGEGIHREAGFLPDPDATDVGFVDRGFDLHVGQVLGDHEQLGRLQAGGHGLPRFDAALDHDAIDRRLDRGAFEIDAGLRLLGFALAHLRFAVLGL
jgi:hypothetical protein